MSFEVYFRNLFIMDESLGLDVGKREKSGKAMRDVTYVCKSQSGPEAVDCCHIKCYKRRVEAKIGRDVVGEGGSESYFGRVCGWLTKLLS